MSIEDFLLARIAEDEALARGAMADMSEATLAASFFPPEKSFRYAKFHTSHTPARVLAECVVKRSLIEFWGPYEALNGPDLLAVMAAAYRDHPDYQSECADR